MIFIGCSQENVTPIHVINQSKSSISEFEVYTAKYSIRGNVIELESYERKEYFVKMPEEPLVDGHYVLRYINLHGEVEYHFGYYTNGYALAEYTITILNDTFNITENTSNQYY